MTDIKLSRRTFLPLSIGGLGAAGVVSRGTRAAPLSPVLPTVLEAGVHRVAANMVLKGDLLLMPGAVIEVARGYRLTPLGDVQAPTSRIFTGEGVVDLNHSRLAFACPEWWGAAPGDGAVDSLAALNSCLASHPVMHLLPGDYYISDSFVVERPFSSIKGAGFRGAEGWRGTRLVLTKGAGDVMCVGPKKRPPSVNDYCQNIEIRDIALCRSQPVDADLEKAPAGLSAQFLLFAHFERLSSAEHAVGFSARGLVRSHFVNCVAFRSLSGVRPDGSWRGFWLNGLDDIGLAGGNASLFLVDCNATIGGDPRLSDGVGLLLEGAFADSFIVNFETAGVATGICVDGQNDRIKGRGFSGHVNLHLRMPIIDQCGHAGIILLDTSDHMMVDISEPYVAVAPGAAAAMMFDAARGAVSITGGQLVGSTDSARNGAAVGLKARASNGLQVSGLKISEHARPVELTGCRSFWLQGWIANLAHAFGRDAVLLEDCQRGNVAMLVNGASTAFASGVAMKGDCQRIQVDVTGFDDAAIQNGATGRVRRIAV